MWSLLKKSSCAPWLRHVVKSSKTAGRVVSVITLRKGWSVVKVAQWTALKRTDQGTEERKHVLVKRERQLEIKSRQCARLSWRVPVQAKGALAPDLEAVVLMRGVGGKGGRRVPGMRGGESPGVLFAMSLPQLGCTAASANMFRLVRIAVA
jgi:hypothetical protein